MPVGIHGRWHALKKTLMESAMAKPSIFKTRYDIVAQNQDFEKITFEKLVFKIERFPKFFLLERLLYIIIVTLRCDRIRLAP